MGHISKIGHTEKSARFGKVSHSENESHLEKSVTANGSHCEKRSYVLTLSLIFHTVTKFSPCDLFFSRWHIFHNMIHFHTVNHFSLSDPFFTLRTIFHRVTHFSKCNQYFTMWPIFLHCDPFLKLWPIFYTLTLVSDCDLLYTMWPIFRSYLLFAQWPTFATVTHFS